MDFSLLTHPRDWHVQPPVGTIRKDHNWWEKFAQSYLAIYPSTSMEFDDLEGTMELVEKQVMATGKVEMGVEG